LRRGERETGFAGAESCLDQDDNAASHLKRAKILEPLPMLLFKDI
jgi:hypothetical protein